MYFFECFYSKSSRVSFQAGSWCPRCNFFHVLNIWCNNSTYLFWLPPPPQKKRLFLRGVGGVLKKKNVFFLNADDTFYLVMIWVSPDMLVHFGRNFCTSYSRPSPLKIILGHFLNKMAHFLKKKQVFLRQELLHHMFKTMFLFYLRLVAVVGSHCRHRQMYGTL